MVAVISNNRASIPATLQSMQQQFRSGVTRPIKWRQQQLTQLAALVREHQQELLQALGEDLGKSHLEGWISEINLIEKDIKHTLKHLRSWMRPQRVSTPISLQPGNCKIHREPLGVVLVIAPWNYPAQLALLPLVGILGAGNCAILKPSEVAPATSALLASIIPKYFNSDTLAVVEGGIPETTELLEQRFDHIFYTGNGTVGRIVMAAAAKHLTPVTLELGGKSPCYVDTHANLDVAAKRIVWAKFFNAGQTCVAPDYILAHKDIHDELLERMTAAITAFYGDNIQNSPDYGRIINERHHRRLMDLLKGETLLCGGYGDETIKFIEPTIVRDVSPDSSLMREEIFGPILPVLPIESTDQAIQFILEREKPLALYVFSENKDSYQRVLQQTSSGGACVNDAMTHLSALDLPFGGVGESGMGHYHGKHGFDTFSHQKSVLDKSSRFDLPLRYPPFNDAKAKWLKRLV